MELGRQINQYRKAANLSQEELAERAFVSRQTISNWENDKSYPDVKSLVLLSEIFDISLDQLVKGDLEKMKKEIDQQEFVTFQRDSSIFAVLLISLIVLPLPLTIFLGWWAFAVFLPLAGITMFFAFRIEKYKKKYDIQTYKEILAFTEHRDLSPLEKAREEGKRPYQKVLLTVGAALLPLLAALVIGFIIKLF